MVRGKLFGAVAILTLAAQGSVAIAAPAAGMASNRAALGLSAPATATTAGEQQRCRIVDGQRVCETSTGAFRRPPGTLIVALLGLSAFIAGLVVALKKSSNDAPTSP